VSGGSADDVAETVEADGAEPDEPVAGDEDGDKKDEEETVSELVERLGRDATALTFYEAQLAASHRIPQVREALQGIIVVALIAIAFVTAFALANWAAASALSNVVPDWAAPLILAAVWTLVGLVLLAVVWRRTKDLREWKWVPVLMGGSPEPLREDLESAAEQARERLRDTLERLSGAAASGAASAMVPLAGGVADGVLDASGDILESTDDFIEGLTEDVPGGGVVNQVWDVVLLPGRFGVRVATTVLRRGGGSSSE
jgi:hypothetical protein